ncbi:MAG: hypothetical protein COU11_02230 [Candidatus Harrisonbacteria bacterium CG10_big_fil_rev_8_21_14_0_10_49_15]|uniref:DUF5667 domain-containing protein n=1 Tax=Candidatus Harrisonbacteria bacterium CG10_big_fil_rev_8_21_14_0_10_49_15 TaxID=1974587 RepID=A0A2H0UMN0_9BACT|nr:MAG: hypothetical protein COU11_02230 [Candidatus Harrisonbacteria bacterium CG10_big_fil_rev_8_21_14_0_10_49_15]
MLKNIILSVAALAIALPVGAQTPPPLRVRTEAQAEMRAETRTDVRPVQMHAGEEVRVQVRMEGEGELRGEAMREHMMEERAMIMENREARRMERTELRAEHRTELRARVGDLQDEKRAERVLKIDERLAAINERMTTHFSEKLSKLQDLTLRIAARADAAEENGADVSTVREALANIDKQVDIAQEAVTAQVGMTYEITFESSDTLRADIQAVKEELRLELVAVKEAVQAAQKTVRDALVALAAVVDARDDVEVEVEAEAEVEVEEEVESES